MPDTGEGKSNPNVYVNFFAKGETTLAADVTSTNTTVMLTVNNFVTFCGDYTTTAAGPVTTLPEGFRPAAPVRLPVLIAGQSSTAQKIDITIPAIPAQDVVIEKIGSITASATKAQQVVNASLNVPAANANPVTVSKTGSITASGTKPRQSVDASLNVPAVSGNAVTVNKNGSITGTVPARNNVNVDVTVNTPSGSQIPMLVSGEFDDNDVLQSAYILPIVNNTESLSMDATATVNLPSQAVTIKDGTTFSGSTNIPARTASGTITVPQQTVSVAVTDNTSFSGSTNIPARTASGNITIPASDIPVTINDDTAISGTVSIPPQNVSTTVNVPVIATLTIASDGTVSCDQAGTICTNGTMFSICDNWY